MSPRSEEFLEQARDRLTAAGEALAAGHDAVAVSVAYYSMLCAARATLSVVTPSTEEAERYAAGAGDFLAAVQLQGEGRSQGVNNPRAQTG